MSWTGCRWFHGLTQDFQDAKMPIHWPRATKSKFNGPNLMILISIDSQSHKDSNGMCIKVWSELHRDFESDRPAHLVMSKSNGLNLMILISIDSQSHQDSNDMSIKVWFELHRDFEKRPRSDETNSFRVWFFGRILLLQGRNVLNWLQMIPWINTGFPRCQDADPLTSGHEVKV